MTAVFGSSPCVHPMCGRLVRAVCGQKEQCQLQAVSGKSRTHKTHNQIVCRGSWASPLCTLGVACVCGQKEQAQLQAFLAIGPAGLYNMHTLTLSLTPVLPERSRSNCLRGLAERAVPTAGFVCAGSKSKPNSRHRVLFCACLTRDMRVHCDPCVVVLCCHNRSIL